MSDLLLEDENNRRRALELASFIVEAPAGAGKTELLTQRILRLLATVDEPEEILAITFTNKAADEMRQRLQNYLERARRGTADAAMPAAHERVTDELARAALARDAALGWQLATQPGRLRLTTIDALCASLARQMPLLSRFGTQPAVAEEARRHYLEAAHRALAHLEEEDEPAGIVATVLGYLDNDVMRLAGLLADMLARREQWLAVGALGRPEAVLFESACALVEAELEAISALLDAGWQRPLMPLARFAASHLGGGPLAEWSDALRPELEALPGWRALAELLLTQKDEPRRTVNVNNGFPAGPDAKVQKEAMLEFLGALDEGTVAALRRLRRLPQPDHADDAVVHALARLLKLAAAELWLVFRAEGEVDFTELALRASVALGDAQAPSELALRLDYRIRHLLVDEFQDTSPTQIELLERLTAGWQAGDGRTLFLVGDPMQSIYRFRKADVGLFLRVAENGIGNLRLESLRLSRNNRSTPALVAWINGSFPAVFPARDEPFSGEIRYRPFVATRDTLPGAGAHLHSVWVGEEDERDTVARQEAAAVVALIEAEWRADPARRVAVLARARDHLGALVTAIRRHPAGWRFAAVELEPLSGRQVIQDLLALTRALHHRADRLNWLAILRAPWCGLRLADLHALAADDHQATIWSLLNDARRIARLSEDGQRRLAHLRAVLGEALAGQGRQRRRRWVEDVWRKLGGAACVEDGSALRDAEAFFERLEVIDSAGRFSVDSLEDDMARLFAAADAVTEGEAGGRLQLMTIHKAKGLEFDTVIVPGLARANPSRDKPLLIWDSFPFAAGERLLAAPVNPRRRKEAVPTLYDFLQTIEAERDANEEARVLYVAATRAIRTLHLLATCSRNRDGMPTPPRAGSPLARLVVAGVWPLAAAGESFASEGMPGAPVDSADDPATFVPQLRRLVAPRVAADWWAPPQAVPAPEAESTGAALAATLGTLTHACLEQIATDPEAWDGARLGQLAAAAEGWLMSRGWASRDSAQGAAQVVGWLRTTLGSEAGRWALRRREEQAAELALTKLGADETASESVTRVIDRSFVEDGVRWIIDWKTAWLGEAADRAQLAQHAERYRPQLERYAALLVEEGLPVKTAVFYVAHGTMLVLD
ncbi:MAG: DNA helicase [Betaproteobacteria bacterium HGW-Betaproteobacteria-11]|nr:MAG: DNA helicase [Betaproteobacteria bacterium HGW-Betaproteobacteria-11]